MDAIRVDTSLLVPKPGMEEGRGKKEDEQAAKMYRQLWDVPENFNPDASPPKKLKDQWLVSALLSFGHTQPAYRERSLDDGDREARVETLVRFGRFTNRVSSSIGADELLRTSVATANAPPFPSVIGAAPALPGPLFQAPLEAERRFVMKLEFRTVYEAFAFYKFRWELVPVKYTPPHSESDKAGTTPAGAADLKPGETVKPQTPETAKPAAQPAAGASRPELAKPPSEYDENQAAVLLAASMAESNRKTLDKAEGERVSDLDLLRYRFAKAAKYHEEDVRTLRRELGPFGVGVSDLATAKTIMSYAGTALSALIGLFEQELGHSSEKVVTFPKPGLYVVRCIGTAVLSGDQDEEPVRAPSVAYHPVFVRPAEEIAAASVYSARSRADDERALKTELETVLEDLDSRPTSSARCSPRSTKT